MEKNFTFTITNETLDGLFNPRSKKKLFNECKKRELVKKCAEQLYSDRVEFYYRRCNDVVMKVLMRLLSEGVTDTSVYLLS